MNYIYLKNNRCEGWDIPMYHHNALEFFEEIKKTCKLIGEGLTVPSKYSVYEYKYKDGTLFKVIIDETDNTIFKIYGKYFDENEMISIYSWC